ncbi:histidine biosynthesis trifunctional protein [Microthyrium microscopicum]|uniref:Histidine biosynthesis trifunctional protein n=1 Tax=Microthyrium microscopicum TaxID=703497 RepID=A0A6A6UAP5_9PEZI|nr:histidine biosynthesis trifunctional protein [Microthyrium microscopicum]
MSALVLPATKLSELKDGLLSGPAAFLGSIFLSVQNVTEAVDLLQRTTSRVSTYLDVTALESIEDITTVLDAGATTVIVNNTQLHQLDPKTLDQDRVALWTTGVTKEEIIESIGDKSVGIFTSNVSDVAFVTAWLKEYGEEHPPVYVSFSNPNEEDAAQVSALGGIPVLPIASLSSEPSSTGSINLAKVLMAGAKSDRPDGLFTTLVVDERGTALGLVYSSEKSVQESLKLGRGVYQSRKRGLWYKGDSSGDTQELVRVSMDCDRDCLLFVVRQKGRGFCHLATSTCFGNYSGLSRLQKTLQSRKASAPEGSYTARLFNDSQLLKAKIMEEASELCEATEKEHIAFEAADLLYFALTKCVAAGVSIEDVERNLDMKALKVKRRPGNAKEQWLPSASEDTKELAIPTPAAIIQKSKEASAAADPSGKITLTRYDASKDDRAVIIEALKRPSQRSTEKIMGIVNPIIKDVQERGDKALLEYTHKFEKATSLTSPVLKAPFPESLMQLPPETIEAIDISFENIRKFHAAQKEERPLVVETMPGVVCTRFSRPIERVGCYVPGGTAVLPSTAMMLGVPAMVAGCEKIVLASPPRADGSVTPEIVYVAHKVGAESIVLAGGAQAIAAMAYGTESVSKVDKILGPGNQFVTAAKMVVSNDTSAAVGIDMPAGPSEVLVIADETAEPAFVAADLLSQAEHGVDSQVVLIAIDLTTEQLEAIETEVDKQANALPRVDIVRGAIDHSVTLIVKSLQEAMELSNVYAPEHLILQIKDAEKAVGLVKNAGSVFIGKWTPESVGDYSAGVNHSLPTYGYARQYSGVNLGSYIKHITASNLTEQGLKEVGPAVMQLAKVEELEAHRRAVSIRLAMMSSK